MAILKSMTKPKPKAKEQVVGEMELDKIVASPYQMAMEQKREKAELGKKTDAYRRKAMIAMSITKK
jgi:hypothetical protein